MSAVLVCAAAALLAWPSEPGAAARLAARRRAPAGGLRSVRPSPLAAGAVAALAGAVVSTPLVAALAACCAGLAMRALLRRHRAAEADGRLRALAEALGALAAELDAGRPPAAAAGAAVRACPDGPTASALAAALAPDTEQHPGPAELVLVRGAVRLSARTGCSLSAVARALEEDLRFRHRQVQQLRTATAGPRASAVVLAGLPVLGLLMGSGIGAHPWTVLTTTGAGQVLLVAGVLLEVAGIAWTGRLSDRAAPIPMARVSGRGR